MISCNEKGAVYINVLSLCDGMSGGQIALKELGISVDKYYASEIKKTAIQVTQKNFPNTIQIGDVMNYIKEITSNGEYIVDGEKLEPVHIKIASKIMAKEITAR